MTNGVGCIAFIMYGSMVKLQMKQNMEVGVQNIQHLQ